MNFNNMSAFANYLADINIVPKIKDAMNQIGSIVEKSAKEQFGEYQPVVGPFEKWEELKESTKLERLKKGFTENDPLLRTGKLKRSIKHTVKIYSERGINLLNETSEVVIGSTSDVMVYQELGTKTIPPRPVLGPALYKNVHEVKKILGRASFSAILPENERSKLYLGEV